MEDTIPVRMLDGRTAHLLADHVLANRHHYHIHTNRRGHIRHAAVKERLSLSPLSHKGEGFQQALDSGIVWALRGVVGSASERAR